MTRIRHSATTEKPTRSPAPRHLRARGALVGKLALRSVAELSETRYEGALSARKSKTAN